MTFKEMIKFFAKRKYIVNEGIWSISITNGNSPICFSDVSGNIPVITAELIHDVKAEFVADPFIFMDGEKYYIFFEILDFITTKGVLGVSESYDGVNWEYKGIILREDFHLSYPQIFKVDNEYYMVPESYQSRQVRIYKADKFPLKWRFEKVILEGKYLDNSIFEYDNKWWMFNEKIEDNRKKSLRLFYSNSLLGEWSEHPKSPIIYDNLKISRPAGNIVNFNNELYRFSQNCSERYGKDITAFRIKKINIYDYEEESIGVVLSQSDKDNTWNKDGMHTVNSIKFNDESYITCMDGYYLEKKNLVISKIKREIIKLVTIK